MLQDGDGRILSPGQSAVSGFAAACIGPVLNNPFDVVKVRAGDTGAGVRVRGCRRAGAMHTGQESLSMRSCHPGVRCQGMVRAVYCMHGLWTSPGPCFESYCLSAACRHACKLPVRVGRRHTPALATASLPYGGQKVGTSGRTLDWLPVAKDPAGATVTTHPYPMLLSEQPTPPGNPAFLTALLLPQVRVRCGRGWCPAWHARPRGKPSSGP